MISFGFLTDSWNVRCTQKIPEVNQTSTEPLSELSLVNFD
jgi:hypothetical protein